MALPRAPDKSKENSVRRVLRQGLFHVCGMCGSRHGNEAQAEACLKNCIARYMAQQTVQDKPDKSGTMYRCAYCKRVYEKIVLAKECAKTCKNEIQKKIEVESRLKTTQTREEKLKNLAAFTGGEVSLPPPKSKPVTRPETKLEAKLEAKPEAKPAAQPSTKAAVAKAPAPAPDKPAKPTKPAPIQEETPETSAAAAPVHPAEGTKFSRDGHSYKCQTCQQKYKKYQEAMSCFDRHREQELAGVSKKREGEECFYRDGAKYACKKCNSKYFARDEVIACFKAHQDEPEVMVTGGPRKADPAATNSESTGKDTLETLRAQRAVTRSEEEKFFRDGAKYVCRVCNKKQFTKSDVIQCFDAHASEASTESQAPDTEPSLSSADLAAVTLEKSSKEKKGGINRDGEEKFYRDGARYICKKCNSKYFTRGEVIECFDKH
jgi:hypothetical protein